MTDWSNWCWKTETNEYFKATSRQNENNYLMEMRLVRFRKDFNSAEKVLWIKKNNKNYLNIPKAIFYYKNVYIFNDLLLFTAIKTDTLTAEVTAILNVAMSLKNAVEWKAVISNQ